MPPSLYPPDEEQQAIWVLLEIDGESLADISFELLAKGRELADEVGWPLVGVLLGQQVEPLSHLPLSHQADEVILIDHPLLKPFSVDAHAAAFQAAILEGKPSVILFGATHASRDIAGRLAVHLRTGLNADCIDLHMDGERGILISHVTGFGGGVVALLEGPEHRPQMATIRPGVFQAADPASPRSKQIRRLRVALDENTLRTRIVERVTGEGINITNAPMLVCGGRGISGEFGMLQELADLLDGEVGATRPPVDEGYVARERQVGQTGVICRPKIALNCGISGAFHFVIGIQDADLIVSINTDPDAPIFEFSDYCVVGDVNAILPALIQVLKQEREIAHA